MLVLTRKIRETIRVDGPCVIHICKVRDGRVKIGIVGEGKALRGELIDRDDATLKEVDDK